MCSRFCTKVCYWMYFFRTSSPFQQSGASILILVIVIVLLDKWNECQNSLVCQNSLWKKFKLWFVTFKIIIVLNVKTCLSKAKYTRLNELILNICLKDTTVSNISKLALFFDDLFALIYKWDDITQHNDVNLGLLQLLRAPALWHLCCFFPCYVKQKRENSQSISIKRISVLVFNNFLLHDFENRNQTLQMCHIVHLVS